MSDDVGRGVSIQEIVDFFNDNKDKYEAENAEAEAKKAEAEAEAKAKAEAKANQIERKRGIRDYGGYNKDKYTVKELKEIASRNNIKITKKLDGKTVNLNKKGLMAKLKRKKLI